MEKLFPPTSEMTSTEFELHVAEFIASITPDNIDADVRHLAKLQAPDGVYEIDVLLTFVIAGAVYRTLIECKKYNHSVKREVVQVLQDRLTTLGAQKGMLFATAPFQSGALAYAKQHGIALVQITDAFPRYETRSLSQVPQEKYFRPYLISLNNENSWKMRSLSEEELKSFFLNESAR